MAGSLSLPRTFATASGNVPASYLDENFTAGKDYINAREVAIGTLAARPAASVAGRWYFASDGGILYVDTGTTWTAVSFAAEPPGGYRVGGLVGAPNATTPLTQYDLTADVVVLRHPTAGGAVVSTNTGALTNNVATAGSTANGRDQAGAFGANSWIHFYFIWNGSTLATLSSATAPPTGPTLPSGYTHWAYAGAVRFNGSSQLTATRMRGATMYYDAAGAALAGGSATTETNVSVAALVPPNALEYALAVGQFSGAADGANLIDFTARLRTVTGVDYRTYRFVINLVSTSAGSAGFYLTIPNVGQAFLYLITVTNGASPSLTLELLSYRVPNGGE